MCHSLRARAGPTSTPPLCWVWSAGRLTVGCSVYPTEKSPLAPVSVSSLNVIQQKWLRDWHESIPIWILGKMDGSLFMILPAETEPPFRSSVCGCYVIRHTVCSTLLPTHNDNQPSKSGVWMHFFPGAQLVRIDGMCRKMLSHISVIKRLTCATYFRSFVDMITD